MAPTTIPAVEKLDNKYIEDASEEVQGEAVVREFDPKFMKKTMLKVHWPDVRSRIAR